MFGELAILDRLAFFLRDEAVRDSLPPRARVLLFGGKDGVAYPSTDTLADLCGIHRRNLHRVCQDLVDAGAVTAEKGRGRGNPTRYRVAPGARSGEFLALCRGHVDTSKGITDDADSDDGKCITSDALSSDNDTRKRITDDALEVRDNASPVRRKRITGEQKTHHRRDENASPAMHEPEEPGTNQKELVRTSTIDSGSRNSRRVEHEPTGTSGSAHSISGTASEPLAKHEPPGSPSGGLKKSFFLGGEVGAVAVRDDVEAVQLEVVDGLVTAFGRLGLFNNGQEREHASRLAAEGITVEALEQLVRHAKRQGKQPVGLLASWLRIPHRWRDKLAEIDSGNGRRAVAR